MVLPDKIETPTAEKQSLHLIEKLAPYSGTIAIDGPGGAGKGNIVKKLSDALNLEQCPAGDMYRAITYYFTDMLKIDPMGLSDEELTAQLRNVSILFDKQDGEQHVLITSLLCDCDKKDVTPNLHSPTIDRCISAFAKRDPVRDAVYKKQSEMLKKGSVIMEGRDMWQIVGKADLRIYVYADEHILAQREVKRQAERGITLSIENAEQIISARNKEDQARVGRGKLLTPQEAQEPGRYDLVIDTSHMTRNEVVLEVLKKLKAVKNHAQYDNHVSAILSPYEDLRCGPSECEETAD